MPTHTVVTRELEQAVVDMVRIISGGFEPRNMAAIRAIRDLTHCTLAEILPLWERECEYQNRPRTAEGDEFASGENPDGYPGWYAALDAESPEFFEED